MENKKPISIRIEEEELKKLRNCLRRKV